MLFGKTIEPSESYILEALYNAIMLYHANATQKIYLIPLPLSLPYL